MSYITIRGFSTHPKNVYEYRVLKRAKNVFAVKKVVFLHFDEQKGAVRAFNVSNGHHNNYSQVSVTQQAQLNMVNAPFKRLWTWINHVWLFSAKNESV